MTTITCIKCWNSYEFYMKYKIIERCPVCGGPDIPTSEEYYRSFGIEYEDNNI